jgi:CRISPR system Cascade subunit CasB
MTDSEIGYKVFDWWKDLTGMKTNPDGSFIKADSGRTGEKAALRRCKTPEQIMLCKGFHRLRVSFKENEIENEALAMIAGICSHVRDSNAGIEFPKLLAIPEKEKSTPPLSEARFQKIVTSRSTSEFFTGLRRAIHIVNNKGNIPSIVKGILLWHKHKNNPATNVQETMLFQWSKAYYDVLLRKDQ